LKLDTEEGGGGQFLRSAAARRLRRARIWVSRARLRHEWA